MAIEPSPHGIVKTFTFCREMDRISNEEIKYTQAGTFTGKLTRVKGSIVVGTVWGIS